MLIFTQELASSSYSGTLYDHFRGKDVYWITLRNGDTVVRITNLGCIITSIHTPDRHGVRKNIVAGFEEPANYKQNPYYFGCVVGRTINRIGGGKFPLNGGTVQLSQNDGSNHLHGGVEGFDKKVWDIAGVIHSKGEVGVVFSYTSPDGEEGYPGNLEVQVKYVLTPENRLWMEYKAVTDKRTPVNLSNHSYFNLTGFDNPLVTDHWLTVHASTYTEKNEFNLPTGKILPLNGTPLNFSTSKRIGDDIDQFPLDKGFDHNYVLDKSLQGELTEGLTFAAELYDPSTGRGLRVATDRPGLQVYTANWWDSSLHTPEGRPYAQHGAVALETQAFPDSPNHAA
ncbi:MAG: aldose epimerase family protein, partial [Bacteroidota bacterium]